MGDIDPRNELQHNGLKCTSNCQSARCRPAHIYSGAFSLGRVHLLAPCSGDAIPISKNCRSGALCRHDVFSRTRSTLGGFCGCSCDLWFVIHPRCAPSELPGAGIEPAHANDDKVTPATAEPSFHGKTKEVIHDGMGPVEVCGRKRQPESLFSCPLEPRIASPACTVSYDRYVLPNVYNSAPCRPPRYPSQRASSPPVRWIRRWKSLCASPKERCRACAATLRL